MEVITGMFLPTIFNPSPMVSTAPVFFILLSVIFHLYLLILSISHASQTRQWFLLVTGFIPVVNALALADTGGLEKGFWRVVFWAYFVFCIAPVSAYILLEMIAD